MSASPPAGGAAGSAESAAYFLIRVRHPPTEDPRDLTGMVERLGIGEKRSFQNGEELLRLLLVWPGPLSKIRAAGEPGNENR